MMRSLSVQIVSPNAKVSASLSPKETIHHGTASKVGRLVQPAITKRIPQANREPITSRFLRPPRRIHGDRTSQHSRSLASRSFAFALLFLAVLVIELHLGQADGHRKHDRGSHHPGNVPARQRPYRGCRSTTRIGSTVQGARIPPVVGASQASGFGGSPMTAP